MKVALYYPWVYLTSGAERSILELVKRSRHDWTIYTNHFDSGNTYRELKEQKIVELERVSVGRSFGAVIRSGYTIAMQRLDLDSFDALLVVCEGIGDMVTFRNNSKPTYCLCLTPLRPVFDPHYRAIYLKERGGAARLKLAVFGMLFKWVDRKAWKRYKEILCISRETYKRVIAGGLATEEKLGLAFPGIDLERFNPTGRLEKFFLIAGRIMWTKNIELGINAFKIFKERTEGAEDFRLVITGIVDKKSEPYYAALRELAGDDPSIEFVIHPEDDELFDLYDRAYAILYTPFNEDWGMVPLEAMAYSKPVVAVRGGGPMETVVHGENGYLAEPVAEDFASYMTGLVDAPEEARRMGEKGRVHVRRYDWKYFVEAVDDMIDGAGNKAR